MTIGDEIAGALSEMEDALADSEGNPPSFTYRNISYPCVISSLKRGNVVITGGKEETIQLTVFLRRSLVTGITVDGTTVTVDTTGNTADETFNAPSAGHKVTHSSRQYRILSVSTAPGGSHWEIELGTVNR